MTTRGFNKAETGSKCVPSGEPFAFVSLALVSYYGDGLAH